MLMPHANAGGWLITRNSKANAHVQVGSGRQRVAPRGARPGGAPRAARSAGGPGRLRAGETSTKAFIAVGPGASSRQAGQGSSAPLATPRTACDGPGCQADGHRSCRTRARGPASTTLVISTPLELPLSLLM
jgi:hypothetical protein